MNGYVTVVNVTTEDTKQIQTSPLRSLPINIVDDMYMTRVGQIILKGTESWSSITQSTGDSNYYYVYTDAYDSQIKGTNLVVDAMCDKLKVITSLGVEHIVTTDSIATSSVSHKIRIMIHKSRVDNMAGATLMDKFKAFLAQNPITFQFELNTPVQKQYRPVSIEMAEGTNIITTTNNVQPIIDLEYYSEEDTVSTTLVSGTEITINDAKEEVLATSTNTVTYTYGNSNWKDQLTSYDGKEITYDAIGNPTSYSGYTYTWQNGRQLAEITNEEQNLSITYKYNDSGIRTEKTVNDVTTKYYLEGSTVIYEQTGESIIYYTYDEQGNLIGLKYNDEQYYYIRNGQNDIIGLLNSNLEQIVTYAYDSWGQLQSMTDEEGNEIYDQSHIGSINPYRYRGYRYDREVSMYYLQSRYYSPEWGRFLNADGLVSTGQGILEHNMYAYCRNNPVNFSDPNGNRDIQANLNKLNAQQQAQQTKQVTIKTAAANSRITTAVNTPATTKTNLPINTGNAVIFENTKVAIVTSRNDANQFKQQNENYVVVIDDRNRRNANMCIVDSYKITDRERQKDVLASLIIYDALYPGDWQWDRTMDSMLLEWDVHNVGYAIGKFSGRSSWVTSGNDADFDNDAIIRRPFAIPFR